MDKKISPERQAAHILNQIRFLFTFWFDLLPVSLSVSASTVKTGRFVGDLSIINDVVTSACFPIDQTFMACTFLSRVFNPIRSGQKNNTMIRKLFMVLCGSWVHETFYRSTKLKFFAKNSRCMAFFSAVCPTTVTMSSRNFLFWWTKKKVKCSQCVGVCTII